MSGLEVNKQFYNEAFKNLIERTQWALNKTKKEVPETATKKLEFKTEPIEITIKNKKWEDEKIKVNSEMKRILWDNYSITEKEAWKYPPSTEWIMRRDWDGGINIERSIWEIRADGNWNLLKWESITFYIDSKWQPLEINIQFTDLTGKESIWFIISMDPSGNIEFTKWWDIKWTKFESKESLKDFLLKNYPNSILKSLDTLLPDRA